MPRPRRSEPHLQLYRGVYAIVYYDGDNRCRLSVGSADQKVARQALADHEARIAKHSTAITLAAALDRYVAHREPKVMAVARMKGCATVLSAALGSLRVDQINQTQWNRYAAARVTHAPHHSKPGAHIPKPVSTGTLRREFNVLRAALRLAWKDDYLPKPPVLEAPADSTPRDRYLTKPEARALLAACITPHVRTFVSLAIFTGARKSSILSLTWDRVDMVRGVIDFQEPGRRITSKRRAIVPIGGQLRAELESARAIRDGEYVVQFNGSAVPTGIRQSFSKACARAGLGWRPTPHHLKHSVASWFAMEKVPIDQAADWLATDPATLRKTYRKFDPAYLAGVAGALEL